MLLAAIGVFVNACGSSNSIAGSTLTQATFDSFLSTASAFTSLKTELATDEATIASLKASSAAVFIRAPNAPTVKVMRRSTESVGGSNTAITKAALPSPCTWTLTGRPTSSDPMQSDVVSGVSCSGYYFNISGAASASDNAYLQPLNTAVYFDGTNCTGTAYVSNIPATAITGGIVFGLNPNDGFTQSDALNSAYYWYIPANSALQFVPMQSNWNPGANSCTNAAGDVSGYIAIQNDPTVTGIANAPIQGPVLVSN
ncbi:MAG: hypothetical protein ACRETC_05755 [Gammaproteobacteria bacterium]